MDERWQFRQLLRGFSYRFLDNELMSAEGDSRQTMIQILAQIAALGLTLSFFLMYKYVFIMSPSLAAAQREASTSGDKGFLLALTMVVTGLTAVVTWDALFPDRRDCLTLSAMPVRGRTVFAAKLTSVLLLFAAVTFALNGPLTLFFPMIVADNHTGLLRYVLAHATASAGASAFVFFTFLAIQGALINTLSFRHYKWISTWIQLGALFLILAGFFLMPDIAYVGRLADPRNRLAAHLLPPFWFLGLYEEILGSPMPIVHELAATARASVLIAMAAALTAYSLGYSRYVRKTVEEADTIPGNRQKGAGILTRWVNRMLVRKPIERAVFHFGARTMSRNRKHRLILALYGGVGLSYVFQSVKWVLEERSANRLHHFDTSISSAPLILSFFMLLGMRVLFTIPVELRSNWVFRLTENGHPPEYLAGVRKLMVVVGIVPLAVGTFPIYGLLWGWAYALRHLILVALILLVVLEYLMRGFPKLPFTCSFLPGKANLKAKFGAYCALFLFFSAVIAWLELWLLQKQRGYWVGVLGLGLVLLYRAWRRSQWEHKLHGFIYEEKPLLLMSLDLQA